MSNFDGSIYSIFEFLKFSASDIDLAMGIAREHDLKRRSSREIDEMEHVSSPKTGKWKDYFTPQHKQAFLNKFGDALIKLGYEKDNGWQGAWEEDLPLGFYSAPY